MNSASSGVEEPFDLQSPRAFRHGYPAAEVAALSGGRPIFWHYSAYEGRGFWMIVSNETADKVSRDPALFSSALSTMTLAIPQGEDLESQRKFLVNMDPPKHDRYRKIANRLFAPQKMAQLGVKIEELAEKIVPKAVSTERCEFFWEVAAPLPLAAIGTFLGVDEEEWPVLHECSRTITFAQEPELRAPDFELKAAGAKLFALASKRYRRDLADPRSSFTGALVDPSIDGKEETLSLQEYGYLYLQILNAGIESTRSMIANGVRLLAEHPDQFDILRNEPELVTSAVEEMLRFDPAEYQVCRAAVADVELGGCQIRRNDKLVFLQHALGRDEAVFENPHRFDVRRKRINHRSFGAGIHFCPGARTARMATRAVVGQLVRRTRGVRLAGPIERLSTRILNVVNEMPVAFQLP